MKDSNIQWCHGTVNPVMGCDGCELWPTQLQIIARLKEALMDLPDADRLVMQVDGLAKKYRDMTHKGLVWAILNKLS